LYFGKLYKIITVRKCFVIGIGFRFFIIAVEYRGSRVFCPLIAYNMPRFSICLLPAFSRWTPLNTTRLF